MIRLFKDSLLVERDDPIEQIGCIILPASVHEVSIRGKVMETGPGKRSKTGIMIPPDVSKGDVVFYGKRAGKPMHINGRTYDLIVQADVFGVER